MRRTRSFTERMADEEKRAALDSMTLTERLLAHVLMQLMAMQARRNQDEIADRLQEAGLSAKQAAALLDTTPQSLAVARNRRKKGDERTTVSE